LTAFAEIEPILNQPSRSADMLAHETGELVFARLAGREQRVEKRRDRLRGLPDLPAGHGDGPGAEGFTRAILDGDLCVARRLEGRLPQSVALAAGIGGGIDDMRHARKIEVLARKSLKDDGHRPGGGVGARAIDPVDDFAGENALLQVVEPDVAVAGRGGGLFGCGGDLECLRRRCLGDDEIIEFRGGQRRVDLRQGRERFGRIEIESARAGDRYRAPAGGRNIESPGGARELKPVRVEDVDRHAAVRLFGQPVEADLGGFELRRTVCPRDRQPFDDGRCPFR
jgi:hypothetical protein